MNPSAPATPPQPTGDTDSSARRVAVWRTDLLRGSETFVRNQLTSLHRWDARAFGLVRVESPLSDPTDVTLFGSGIVGKVRRKIFERTRRSRRLERLLRDWSPQLVHAHFVWDAGLIVPTLRRLGIPLAVTAHGYDVAGDWSEQQMRRHREVFDYATTVIAVSQFIRTVAIDIGASPQKTVVRYIGIPLDDAVSVDSVSSPDRAGILFVGRLVEKKGVDVLLRAVDALPGALRSTPLTVVGAGPDEPALRQLASDLGLQVDFLGAQPPARVGELMERALVFCGPSRRSQSGDSEGLGLVFLEAAAHGAAVVSTHHGGIPEAVIDGKTGYLVEENRADLLAEALTAALTDDAERQRRAAAALAHVRSEFELNRCTEALERVYDDVAAGRASATEDREAAA